MWQIYSGIKMMLIITKKYQLVLFKGTVLSYSFTNPDEAVAFKVDSLG